MQAWHCITIIVITVALFIYGTFRNEVEEHIYKQGVEKLVATAEAQIPKPTSDTIQSKVEDSKESSTFIKSPAWAEYEIMLKCDPPVSSTFHLQAIKGASFIEFLLDKIHASTTARDLIFSPFQSDFFDENDKSILNSLFAAKTLFDNNSLIAITCRGHSAKSANLLSNLIVEAYEIALLQETAEKPLPGILRLEYEKIKELHVQIIGIKEQLAEEKMVDSRLNVEAIALRSEIQVLEQESQNYKRILTAIDKIFRDDLPKISYLEIDGFDEAGTLKDISETISSLENMLKQSDLGPTVRTEVEKNLKVNQALFENEIALAIERIKEKSINGLGKKKILSRRIVDLHKDEGNFGTSKYKYDSLKNLETELEERSLSYQRQYQEWKRSTYSILSVEMKQN